MWLELLWFHPYWKIVGETGAWFLVPQEILWAVSGGQENLSEQKGKEIAWQILTPTKFGRATWLEICMHDLRAYGISIVFHIFFDTRFLTLDKVF